MTPAPAPVLTNVDPFTTRFRGSRGCQPGTIVPRAASAPRGKNMFGMRPVKKMLARQIARKNRTRGNKWLSRGPLAFSLRNRRVSSTSFLDEKSSNRNLVFVAQQLQAVAKVKTHRQSFPRVLDSSAL